MHFYEEYGIQRYDENIYWSRMLKLSRSPGKTLHTGLVTQYTINNQTAKSPIGLESSKALFY